MVTRIQVRDARVRDVVLDDKEVEFERAWLPEAPEPEAEFVEAIPLLPENFTLGSLRDRRLRVVEAIEVVPRTEGGKHVLEAPELNEFGFGDNLSESLSDLQAAIVELYLTLEIEPQRLGPDLESVWAILSQKVRKVDAADRSRI